MRNTQHAGATGRRVHSHHLFIHQYFITKGQRWVVAVGQIFSPYSPPIRTHLPTSPYSTAQSEPSLPYVTPQLLRAPTDGNRENGTSLSVPYLSAGGYHKGTSLSIPSRNTPNLAAPRYLAPPHGSHTVRSSEKKGRGEGRDNQEENVSGTRAPISVYQSHQRESLKVREG